MSDGENKYQELIDSISKNRQEMYDMIHDVQEFRKGLDTLLPKNNEFKNRFIWEERMKSISSLISTELSIRKAVDDSVKNEITLLDRFDSGGDGEDINDRRSIELIAEAILKTREKQRIKVDEESINE